MQQNLQLLQLLLLLQNLQRNNIKLFSMKNAPNIGAFFLSD